MRGERRQYLTFDQLEHEQTERKIEFSRLTLNQPSMRMKKVHPSRDRKKIKPWTKLARGRFFLKN
jgi:hypothetical protein